MSTTQAGSATSADDRAPGFDATAFSLDAMLDDLRVLVEIESPSLDLPALQASAEAVAGLIERRLGGSVTPDREPGRTARALVRGR